MHNILKSYSNPGLNAFCAVNCPFWLCEFVNFSVDK